LRAVKKRRANLLLEAPDRDTYRRLGAEDANGVPAPSSRGVLGKARAIANRAFAETVPLEADGHAAIEGNGHGNGHLGNGHAAGADEEEAAVGAPSTAGQLPAGDGPDDSGSGGS